VAHKIRDVNKDVPHKVKAKVITIRSRQPFSLCIFLNCKLKSETRFIEYIHVRNFLLGQNANKQICIKKARVIIIVQRKHIAHKREVFW